MVCSPHACTVILETRGLKQAEGRLMPRHDPGYSDAWYLVQRKATSNARPSNDEISSWWPLVKRRVAMAHVAHRWFSERGSRRCLRGTNATRPKPTATTTNSRPAFPLSPNFLITLWLPGLPSALSELPVRFQIVLIYSFSRAENYGFLLLWTASRVRPQVAAAVPRLMQAYVFL